MTGSIFPPIKQSPDDLMDLPIGDLVRKLDRRVRRLLEWQNMAKATSDETRLSQIQAGAVREIELVQIAATALRARAAEVVRFAASVHIRCRVEDVRGSPHLVACALMKVILGPRYGKET